MPSSKNIEQLEELKGIFESSDYLVSTQYKDVSANDMVMLRKSLNSSGAKYRIIKNNIAYLAADSANLPDLKDIISGTCAIMITNGDPALSSKSLIKSIKDQGLEINIMGAILNGDVLTSESVKELSKLPSKDELIAKVVGQIGSPISGFVFSLSSQISSLTSVLNNIAESKK